MEDGVYSPMRFAPYIVDQLWWLAGWTRGGQHQFQKRCISAATAAVAEPRVDAAGSRAGGLRPSFSRRMVYSVGQQIRRGERGDEQTSKDPVGSPVAVWNRDKHPPTPDWFLFV